MTVRPSEKADVLYSWGGESGVTTLSPFSTNHAGAGLGANFTDIESAGKLAAANSHALCFPSCCWLFAG
jgi:hypothetical protein